MSFEFLILQKNNFNVIITLETNKQKIIFINKKKT